MSAIHDLLKQIGDPRLRERIAREYEFATRHKKFGLVFEQHLPELVPIYGAVPRKGDLVAKRGGPLGTVWRVRRVQGETATLAPARQDSNDKTSSETLSQQLGELVVVKQFGEPIYPALTYVDAVQNGPNDAPWHTLIEADNYHALQLLEYLYARKVDCIYIDPPYNTGARDWKYNNNYVDSSDNWRHSKWLSFMEKRLQLAKRLLKPETGVLICTIDEHEVHHLGVLLEQLFPDCYRQLVTIVITSRGVAAQGLARVEEYAHFVYSGRATASATPDDFLTSETGANGKNPWASLLRRGTNASPYDRPGLVYPIHVDPNTREIISVGTTLDDALQAGQLTRQQLNTYSPKRSKSEIWPIRKDGRLGTWQVNPARLIALKKLGYVKLGRYDEKRNAWAVNYLKRGPISKIARGEIQVVGYEWDGGPAILAWDKDAQGTKLAKSVWYRTRHDAGTYGSSLLQSIIGNRQFDFPKSLYAVKDTLSTIVGDNPHALVLDFFAGSGTTLNAVNLLNAADNGSRRCIVVTNNEVSDAVASALYQEGLLPGQQEWESKGICRAITWPRSKYTILGRRDDGTPLADSYATGQFVEREKSRNYQYLAFVSPENFRLSDGAASRTANAVARRQRSLVALIDGIPQSAVTEGCQFIVREENAATILFDPTAVDGWLAALEEQDQVTDFFVVAENEAQFREIRARVEDLLGPQIIQEEERRPMAEGFVTNLAYFKLDFLDKDRVELGAAFRDILPLLWLKAGAIGPRPELPDGPLPNWLAPSQSPFAVLIKESNVKSFRKALKGRADLSHVFIVTDAEEAFRAIADELRSDGTGESTEFVQLYRDYLVNFAINARIADASSSPEGAS